MPLSRAEDAAVGHVETGRRGRTFADRNLLSGSQQETGERSDHFGLGSRHRQRCNEIGLEHHRVLAPGEVLDTAKQVDGTLDGVGDPVVLNPYDADNGFAGLRSNAGVRRQRSGGEQELPAIELGLHACSVVILRRSEYGINGGETKTERNASYCENRGVLHI